MIKIHNTSTFASEIEKAVQQKDLTYLEAIVEFCQETGMDFSSIPKLITPILKDKLESEAIDLRLLKRGQKGKKLRLK
jgi:hypothetical protein